ncbi:MAG: LolA family protein [Phycisphaerae bacterium]
MRLHRPTRIFLLAAALAMVTATGLADDTTTTRPSDPNATASKLPDVEPGVRRILEAMEKAAGYKNIRAELTYKVYDRLEGSSETRSGWVIHKPADPDANAPAKFAIHFETLQRDKKPRVRERIDYAFDGRWLTVAKEKVKQVHRIQVAGKNQRIEPMRLGRGPFPMPFGQKVDDMLRFFDISTRDPRSTDPNGTAYLELVTRPEMRPYVNFLKLEMWLDRKTNRPVKLVSHQGDPTRKVRRKRILKRDIFKRTTVTFGETKTNVDLPEDTFRPEAKRGWKVIVEPMKKPAAKPVE